MGREWISVLFLALNRVMTVGEGVFKGGVRADDEVGLFLNESKSSDAIKHVPEAGDFLPGGVM
jgi:hypothetical protein